MDVLPKANTNGERRRPTIPTPAFTAEPAKKPFEMPTIQVSPLVVPSLGKGKPLLALGNPPLAPRGHLATLPYTA